jgi:tetratricopeptide (TPR) repeat protein
MTLDPLNPVVPGQDAPPAPKQSHLLPLVFLLAFGILVGGVVLLQLQPNPEALYSKGLEAAKKHQHDTALNYLNQAIAARPGYAEAYLARAGVFYDKKDYHSAIADYNRLMSLRPGDSNPYAGRGNCYSALKDYDKALADLNKAVWHEPRSAWAVCCRGHTYLARQEYSRAIADFTKAIELDAGYFDAFHNRGYTFTKTKEYDKALVDLNKAIRLAPDNGEGYMDRAAVFEARRQFPQAMTDYREVVRLNPQSVDGCNALAWLLATCPVARLRNGLEAVELATKACTLTSWTDGFCLGTLAAAHAEAGNFPEAVKWQKKSLAYPKDDPQEQEKARQRLALFEAGQPYHQE